MARMWVSRLFLVFIVLMGLAAGCVPVTTSELEIVEAQLIATEHAARVVGVVRNAGNKELQWPLVGVQMYEEGEEGELEVVYIWYDRIERLPPGESWRFEVDYWEGTASDYEVFFDHPLHLW